MDSVKIITSVLCRDAKRIYSKHKLQTLSINYTKHAQKSCVSMSPVISV